MDASLRKYMGPRPQWRDNNTVLVDVYYLDPSRFDDFKAAVEAGGEYVLYDERFNDKTNDGPRERTQAWWEVLSNNKYGRKELKLWKDWKESIYQYVKTPGASGLKDELLRKYMGPESQYRDNNTVLVYVYYLDPLRFEAFKAELDAGGEYYEADSWTNTRDWEKDMTFARWCASADGSKWELELCKEDNTISGYRYQKVPQVGDTWVEQWNEGKITLTYLGLQNPGLVERRKGGGRGEYKGYYTFNYENKQDGDNGGNKCYVYYPSSGKRDDGVLFGKWLE